MSSLLRRIPVRKILRIVAYVLAGSWAVYLIGINVVLRTRLFRNLVNADPTTMLVEYSSAYSLVPGRVHAEGLSIRGSDSNVQWRLTLDRCDVRFGLSDFLHERFHATHVRADGVSFRVRLKQPSFTAERAAALPPVPGFSDPPMAGPPSPPITDAEYNLWTIWLEDVVADHVREVWVDTMRYTGDFDVRGRWFFRPLRWLDIGPATVEFHTLDMSYGPRERWASGATGRLQVTVHPYDVRTHPGLEVLERFSVSGSLRGEAHVATVAERVLRGTPFKAIAGESSFDTDIAVDHGVLEPGTRAHLERFPATASALGLDLEAALEASATVADDRIGRLALEAHGLAASEGKVRRATAVAVTGALESRDIDLTHPFVNTSYEVALDGLATPSLKYWHSRVPLAPGLTIDSGNVTVSGQAEGSLTKKTVAAHLRTAIQGLIIERGRERVRADVSSAVTLSASLPEHRGDFSASELSLEGVRAEVRGVTITATRIAVRAPRLVVAPAGLLGQVTVDAPSVDVPSLAPLGTLLPLPSGVALEHGRAHAQAQLVFDLGEGAVAGTAQIVGRDIEAHVGSMEMRGDLELALRARQNGSLTDVSGSSLRFRPQLKDGWWARVDLPQATMSLRGGGRVSARVIVQAQDASPITALLESHADLAAKLALGVVSTSDLRVSGEIVAAPSAFEARSFVARADGLGVDFELAKLGRDRIGAAYLVVGPVRAGVDLENDATNVMLFGAEPWFVAKRAALRARERAYE